MTDKILHAGKFVELRVKEGPDYKYEYLHESRCDGHIVSFLPYQPGRGYLLRHELTPCWGESESGYHLNSFTGGWEKDKHETPIDTVIDELREEAGIILPSEDLIESVGTCRGSKSSDTLYHLFIVDLNHGYEEVPIEPDGPLESKESIGWYSSLDLISEGVDPLLIVMYTRLRFLLGKKVDRSQYNK